METIMYMVGIAGIIVTALGSISVWYKYPRDKRLSEMLDSVAAGIGITTGFEIICVAVNLIIKYAK